MPLLRGTPVLRLTVPTAMAPETTPVKYTTHLMTDAPRMRWFNGQRHDFIASYRERNWLDTWPSRKSGWEKGHRHVLTRQYSPAALREALKMVPQGFEVRDVPRPPQRIRAVSEGIVGRWYTNYWTLHSIKYQCFLANIPWEFGERVRPRTNFDEPYNFVDFEESKGIRDYRSRWINVNRSMVGMTKKIKEAEEEKRLSRYKKEQDMFWSNRKVLITRVKSMASQGLLETAEDLPVKTLNFKAFLREE